MRYKLQSNRDELNDRCLTTILDRSESMEDLLIDYRECKPAIGARARLIILGAPKGMTPAVAEFTVFGKTIPGK